MEISRRNDKIVERIKEKELKKRFKKNFFLLKYFVI